MRVWGMSDSDGTSPSPVGTEARRSSPRDQRTAARDERGAASDDDEEKDGEEGVCAVGVCAGRLLCDL